MHLFIFIYTFLLHITANTTENLNVITTLNPPPSQNFISFQSFQQSIDADFDYIYSIEVSPENNESILYYKAEVDVKNPLRHKKFLSDNKLSEGDSFSKYNFCPEIFRFCIRNQDVLKLSMEIPKGGFNTDEDLERLFEWEYLFKPKCLNRPNCYRFYEISGQDENTERAIKSMLTLALNNQWTSPKALSVVCQKLTYLLKK